MKTNRRDFLRISAMGMGAAALSGGAMSTLHAKDGTLFGKSEKLETFPTYCEICFWKCAAWTHVNENKEIVKIIGNDIDPHCNGRLCPRGTGGVGMYTDPDRLTKPLIRVTKDGKQTFRDASWAEALDLIANKFKELSEKYGPESIALFKHGTPGDHLGHLFKAMGSNTITAPSYAQCRGPREAGWKATFGKTVGSPEPTDIRDTQCLVLIGSHLGENMHNSQVQEMSDAIDNDADIITVDPRFSTAASKSKYWLPIKPSTDLALLLAWINVIITEGLYDKDYVEKYTTGFERLKIHVRRMTPEWAYGITTIKPDLIRKSARLMAKAAPSVIIHPGRHVTWYGDDTQRSRAIAILNAILGSWGRRGGFFFSQKAKIPKYPYPDYPKPKWSWKDLLNNEYPLAGLSVSNTVIDASIENNADDENRVRAWMVAGTNLPLTMPEKDKFEAAAQSVEFIAVLDTMPMEITGYADVVLPECTYLERYDNIRSAPGRASYIALRMPAVEPLGESKPGWWVAKQLGEKLGLGKYFPYEDYTEVLSWQLEKMGYSLKQMKKEGVIKTGEAKSLYLDELGDHSFATESGKIELYSKKLEELGFDPLPNYKAHPQPPADYYRLNYGRAPMHTFSRTANNPNLTDLMDENKLWVNPKVANNWGLKSNQEVWLKNQDGAVSTFPIKVRITERIRWDSVYMIHGFGHSRRELTQAFGKGANDSEMITDVKIDPMMGGTGMRGNFVTFLLDDPAKTDEI